MVTANTVLLTADEFWDWCQRPENADRRCELVLGEIVDMPPPMETHGLLCAWIAHLLWSYVLRRGAGRVLSNDTGLLVSRGPDTVRGVDVMLFAASKSLDAVSRRYLTEVPELVVEVISPTDRHGQVTRRVTQYLRFGIPLVWLVDPEIRIVTVYRPGQEQLVLEEEDELMFAELLPGFACKVADLFALPGGNAQTE